jgi:hypothetical protein
MQISEDGDECLLCGILGNRRRHRRGQPANHGKKPIQQLVKRKGITFLSCPDQARIHDHKEATSSAKVPGFVQRPDVILESCSRSWNIVSVWLRSGMRRLNRLRPR